MDGRTARFGKVDFDVSRDRLVVAGQRVRLDRPCMVILATLLGEAGQVVDKGRLLEAGWPGRVVHENSLAKAVGRLRLALGEDGAALETVHGYGYRLAADPIAIASPAAAPADPPGRSHRTALVMATLGLAAVAVVTLAVLPGRTWGLEQRGLQRGEAADALGRVLWVDDHPENNAVEKGHLEGRKIAVYQVATSEEALALLSMYEYRAVISDMNRHGKPLAGLDLVREMRARGDATPFILYTIVPSAAQRSLLVEAGGQHAAVTPDELYSAVHPLFAAKGS